MMGKKSSIETAEVDPAESPEEGTETYILLSGKHTRRLPDGTSERFYPGDEIPNPTPQELASFGDKIVSAAAFAAMVSAHAMALQSERNRQAAKATAKSQGTPILQKDRDPDAVKRAKVLDEIRAEEMRKSAVRL